jgi:ABC-type branched-subunit amino acid transport system substrate-binding protein
MNAHLKGGANIHRAVAALFRRRCLWPTLMVPLVLGLAACGGGGGGNDGPGSTDLNLVIGNSLPLSGASESLGDSGEKASALAVDQLKQAISEAGANHTVRAISEDQGADSNTATESAAKLADEDNASCLTGPWSSDAVEQSAKEITIPGKVLEIAPVPTSENVAELSDRDLINSTALPESLEGSALSNAIDEELGGAQGKSVSVASSSNTYGDTLSQDFIEEWQGKDGTVSEQTVLATPPLSTSSAYSGQAYQITSNDPDAILLIDGLDGFSQLAPALASNSSWDASTTWGSDQLVSPSLPGQVGADTIDGMRALAPGAPKGEEASSAFARDFKSADPHDVKLAPFAAQEFDATVLCYLAAVAAGSTDGQEMADHLIDITAPGGDEFSWQQLPDAIEALEDGEDIDYTGASGPIDMNVNGDPTAGVFDIYEYTADGLEVAGEVSVEKPNPATL